MAIGLTARQRKELAAMLPSIEESVASLKRLIADAKDRTRAMSKLADAEEAHKRHALDIGIPFNAEAFARRRAELNALPKVLTVEEGQLTAFAALQRAIGVIIAGPFVREGRGASGASRKKSSEGKAKSRSRMAKRAVKPKKRETNPGKAGARKQSAAPRKPSAPDKQTRVAASPRAPAAKPLPLSLGS